MIIRACLFEEKKKGKKKTVWSVSRTGIRRSGEQWSLGEEGRGSLNLAVILHWDEHENIKKLGTGSELFMNTPRFALSVVLAVLMIVVLLAVLVVLLVVVLLVILLIILVVVLIGHGFYLLLKECNSSMSAFVWNIHEEVNYDLCV